MVLPIWEVFAFVKSVAFFAPCHARSLKFFSDTWEMIMAYRDDEDHLRWWNTEIITIVHEHLFVYWEKLSIHKPLGRNFIALFDPQCKKPVKLEVSNAEWYLKGWSKYRTCTFKCILKCIKCIWFFVKTCTTYVLGWKMFNKYGSISK